MSYDTNKNYVKIVVQKFFFHILNKISFIYDFFNKNLSNLLWLSNSSFYLLSKYTLCVKKIMCLKNLLADNLVVQNY